MLKLVGLGIGFVLIVGLVSKKKPLYLAMFVGALVTGLSTGRGLGWLAVTWGRALISPDTLELAAMVGCVTLLSYIRAVSKLHERLVSATIRLLRSAKLAVMVIPPLIGAMPIPGGAIVSAPLIDQPGKILGLSQARKAAINLTFRHANFFVLPFSSSMILASKLINVDIYSLIPRMAPLALAMWVVGYLTLVRRSQPVLVRGAEAASSAGGEDAAGFDGVNGPGGSGSGPAPAPASGAVGPSPGREFLVSASPILLALFIGFVFGVPFWLAVAFGIGLALAVTWRSYEWTPAALIKGVDVKLILAMFGIMSFRAIVVAGDSLSPVAAMMDASAVPLPVLAFGIALLISLVSANHNTTLGIVYPMILPLVAPGEVLSYAVLVFTASFIAYFASPLHLCQILTNEYCKVSLPAVFREYVWVLIGMAVTAWAVFFLYLPGA